MIKKIVRSLFSEKTRLELYYAYFKIRSLFYRGTNVYCVCCDRSFSKFLPYGNNPRAGVLCPFCHSLERTRMLDYYLQNETEVYRRSIKILHFAPEKALEQKLKAAQKSNYVSADINPAFADVVVDIQAIPFEENSFDLIICSHVLGHIPDEKKAIDEMYRVLKPGGSALILTVLDFSRKTYENPEIKTPEERLHHFGEPDLLRLHGTDFIRRLERDRVNVEQIDYAQQFSEEEKEKFRLGDRERGLIFKCVKLA